MFKINFSFLFLSTYRLSARQLLAMAFMAILSLTHPVASAAPAEVRSSASGGITAEQSTQFLDVYKSPTCGCCQEWIDHMEAQGFRTDIHHPAALNEVKAKYQIAPQYQSCHTAVSPTGYVFEGHIPAKIIERFLTEKPADAIGLAVPGMPMGSPGMEMGNRFTPYDVLLLKTDGSTQVYARINAASEQY